MRDLKNNKAKKVKTNRLKQQKQPRDWKKLFHRVLRITVAIGSGTLIVSGSLLTAQMLLESGYFSVNKVRVEHQARVSEGDILDMSDIVVGDGIFELDLHMIGSKIEENPWIESAEVERVFPDEVVIRVSEREPRAIVDLGYLYYLDESGEVFKMLDADDRLDFPVVTGIDREMMIDQQDEVQEWLLKSLSLMKQIEGRALFNLDDISEVYVDLEDGLTVYTRIGGVPVHLGHKAYVGKLDRLERIYADLEPRLRALEYIDLNVADRVIVKVDVKRTIGRS
jgi:cell division protein FtsQ